MQTAEEENLYRLLRSEEIENVMLGLELAKSLQISIKTFLSEIRLLAECSYVEKGISIEAQILHVNQCTNLKLYQKKLKSLPESIDKLFKLMQLDISSNNLTTLPDSIGNLTRLWYLSANNNQLIQLPESIGSLRNLARLFCQKINLQPFLIQ
ncbi:hypothetical protein [Xanthocytophaga agilis]|uniref:Disease resistance R13L4/SHOC-2-like LRR domain-containing protein n=1 Tax=Xanthocytophaga agilis TaxID=3048010 RepID=A0AAE3R8F4_9BACT|nr:hypothetical protein [Xanthocytophaga agilis]MDJ1505664.1 hypothetical protein [Xanthocytophaga agilis]